MEEKFRLTYRSPASGGPNAEANASGRGAKKQVYLHDQRVGGTLDYQDNSTNGAEPQKSEE
jgi:hypothetical protein